MFRRKQTPSRPLSTEICRKCGGQNAPSNEYCMHCGAVLLVSTAMMAAQPRRVLPVIPQFRWRWVGIGVLTLLGTGVLTAGAGGLIWRLAGSTAESGVGWGLLSLASRAFWFLAASAAMGGMLGGMFMSRMSAQRRVFEAIIAAICVVCLAGAAAGTFIPDMWIAALVLLGPYAFLAGVGAWLGDVTKGTPS